MTAQVGELTSMLRAMKLNAMADELERQFTERSYKEMSFGDRMDLIVTSEWNRRQTNKLNRYLKLQDSLSQVPPLRILNTMKTVDWIRHLLLSLQLVNTS